MTRKKKKKLPPRRMCMKRSARLLAARKWLATYKGKNVIHGYARWFGTDKICAVIELQMLGVKLDKSRVKRIRLSAGQRKRPRADPEKRNDLPEGYGVDWDDKFSRIVDFTESGAPIGLTWEEFRGLELEKTPRPPQERAEPVEFRGTDRIKFEALDEIRGFLHRWNISEAGIRHLSLLAGHDDAEVREMASLVLEIARVHPRRRKRFGKIRSRHPDLWRRMIASGILEDFDSEVGQWHDDWADSWRESSDEDTPF